MRLLNTNIILITGLLLETQGSGSFALELNQIGKHRKNPFTEECPDGDLCGKHQGRSEAATEAVQKAVPKRGTGSF